jgi:hypothetical protein
MSLIKIETECHICPDTGAEVRLDKEFELVNALSENTYQTVEKAINQFSGLEQDMRWLTTRHISIVDKLQDGDDVFVVFESSHTRMGGRDEALQVVLAKDMKMYWKHRWLTAPITFGKHPYANKYKIINKKFFMTEVRCYRI